jgi:hypothetical protein
MHKIGLALTFACALAACSPPQAAKEETPATAQSEATIAVTAPRPGDHIKSPFEATGTAPNNWFFEASFPTMLVGADSRVIAEAPAQAQTDWMTPGPVSFRATLTFHVDTATPATLVLQEDMPGEEEDHPTGQREIRIPVVLEPN